MSTLSIFDEPTEPQREVTDPPKQMYQSQRTEIRQLFGELGVTGAREQFTLVEETIGVRLNSVADLSAADAQRLIPRLQSRVQASARRNTGNSWDDRDEDTWIDKL